LGVLLLFSIPVFERVRGDWLLNRKKKQLEERGVILDVRVVVQERLTKQSSTTPFTAAANPLKELTKDIDVFPPAWRFTGSNGAFLVLQSEGWLARDGRKLITNKWNLCEQVLERKDGDLREVMSIVAQRGSSITHFNYTNGFLDFQTPGLLEVPTTVKALCWSALLESRNRKTNESFSKLCSAITLAQRSREDFLLIHQLVGQAAAYITIATTWQLLQTDVLTSPQLKELQSLFLLDNYLQDIAKSLRVECAMTVDHFRLLRQLNRARQQATEAAQYISQDEPTSGEQFAINFLQLPLWKLCFAPHDELNALRKFEMALNFHEELLTKSRMEGLNWRQGKKELQLFNPASANLSLHDRTRFLFSRSGVPLEPMVTRAARTETLRNLAATAIALKRYYQAHGKYPARLEELVPDFLDTVLPDLLTQEGLRYRRTNDSFLLYSVGSNGKDDDGNGSPTSSLKTMIFDGADMVWPVPVRAQLLPVDN
jgi:hypothetical protein